MSQKHSLFLILKSKPYLLPSVFKHITDISTNISDSLIFNHDHSYQVESNARPEVFQSFVDYLVDDKMPDINIENINEFQELSEEFNVLKEEIERKKEEYGEHLINLNSLLFHEGKDVSEYEEKITTQLDEYIDKYSNIMEKLEIQRLYNIFYHHKRILKQHNEAYEFIKKVYDKTKNPDIFILLDSLEGNHLTKNNLNESISLRKSRHNHIPNIDFSYFIKIIDENKLYETRIFSLETQLKQYQEETTFNIKNQVEKTANIENQFKQYQEEIQSQNIKQKEEIEKLTTKIANIESQFKQYQDEIKSKIKNQEEEDKSIKEIIKEKDNEHRNEIQNIKEEHRQEIENFNSKLNFLENKLKENEEKIETEKENSEKRSKDYFEQLQKNIEEIKENIDKCNNELKFDIFSHHYKSITTQLNFTNRGILGELKEREKSKYDQLFITSQSSDDIYNLINPNSIESFETSNMENFFIEFELKDEITINGMKIFSANTKFPKSFNIEINEVIVKSIEEANELNGANKEMTIDLDPIKTQKVRFVQTGKNWDKNTNHLCFKRIELLSNEAKYSKGVFSSLIYENEYHDPHKIGVIITASFFDFNNFYLLNSTKNICTANRENSWFQVELTKGLAIIYGFRLKKYKSYKLKNYKIICTNNIEKVEKNEWTKIFEINEQSQNDNKEIDIYEFDKPSPPTKFIRIVQTGKNWNNDFYLSFYHFDIFGTYY